MLSPGGKEGALDPPVLQHREGSPHCLQKRVTGHRPTRQVGRWGPRAPSISQKKWAPRLLHRRRTKPQALLGEEHTFGEGLALLVDRGDPIPTSAGRDKAPNVAGKGKGTEANMGEGTEPPALRHPPLGRETRSSWCKECTPVGRDGAPGFPARGRGSHASLAKRGMAPRLPGRGKGPIAHHG